MRKGPQIGPPVSVIAGLIAANPLISTILLVMALTGVGIACAFKYFYSNGPIKNLANTNNEPTENIRNILITGRTGSGKSTLGNVLLGREKFAEVAGSTSGTKEIQSETFESKENRYCVIDTIGTGDTAELSDEAIRSTIEKLCKALGGNRVHKVFFVYKDRFTKVQIEALKLFKETIRSSYFIIVCTNFPEFEDKKKCDEDIKKLLKDNQDIAGLISGCQIIHIDNPPLHYGDLARKTRESSRKKLLNHLEIETQ